MSDAETNHVASNFQTPKDGKSYFYFFATMFVFLIAGTLRVLLSLVNREANDDHYEVVKLILNGRTGLTMLDCHECFHPKFFYYVCAALLRGLDLTIESSRIVAGQLLNTLAGLITLLLVFLALNASRCHAKWRLWTFTLVAINPRFIAINGQFSNDSFAILFATGAIFLTQRLLTSPGLWSVALSQVLLSCALMTKGTTWIVAIAMLMVFVIRALLDESKNRSLLFLVLFVATAMNGILSIQLAGYDFERYDVYANMGRNQPLYIWEKTSVGRPGVQSIVDGYLTFRIFGLLSDPQITNGIAIEQAHRTSVWTQLYARANFAQFEQHPKSWLTTDSYVMVIAKCSFVLGLIPLLFLVVGLVRGGLREFWELAGQRKVEPDALERSRASAGTRPTESSILSAFQVSCQLLPPPGQAGRKAGGQAGHEANFVSLFSLLVCLGYIAFIIKFTADYRDFAAMKLIYMLPGVLPFALALLEGMQTVMERMTPVRFADRMVHCLLFCLVILHGAGIVALVWHLADR